MDRVKLALGLEYKNKVCGIEKKLALNSMCVAGKDRM